MNWHKVIKYLTNKYIIICIIFVVIAFDSISERISNTCEIARCERGIAKYKAGTAKCEKEIDELNANKNNIEQLAREKYRMRAEGEDVFVEKK
jgi:cell division protein FtsB